ncbi:MAG TPA: PASTA domain-containing protein, partial [Gemmatimonadaceae bacterium]|nr:PASTA domain-containing protein [Gemmatimonadaceae bacterium]
MADGLLSRVAVAPPRGVVVPNVVGRSTDVAQQILTKSGLGMAPRDSLVSGPPPGTVLRQNPPAGDSAPLRSTVTVIAAKAIPLVAVPELTNMPLARASLILRRAGLTLGAVKPKPSPELPQTVLAQLPQAGDSVEPGRSVALQVASPQQRTVPDVTRHSVDDARQIVASENLKLMHDSTPSPTGPYRIVVEQTPRGGDLIPNDRVVRVHTFFPPPMKVMPNVLGLTRAAATARLAADTIPVRSVGLRVSADSVDLVVRQVPDAGQPLSAGTRAMLTIGAQQQLAGGSTPPSTGPPSGIRDSTPPRAATVNDASGEALVPPRDTAQTVATVPDSVDVPDVRHRRLADAREVLHALGLGVNVAVSASDTETVATQTPFEGRVPPNAVVRLTVDRARLPGSTTTTT